MIELLAGNTGIWILMLVTLVGTVLNVLKKRSGFAVWTVTNAGWVLVNVHKGIPAQAILFLTFLALSAWGFWSWGKKEPSAPAETVEALRRLVPALETAAHLMRLHGSEEEAALFDADAKTARDALSRAA